MNWTQVVNVINTCHKDVTFTWNACKDTNKYSVSLNQYPGADPGPLADTYINTYSIKDVVPGKLYFNLKPGNNYGWGKVWYWSDLEITIPPSTIDLEIDDYQKLLKYKSQCIKSLKIEPELGKIDDMRSGMFNISTNSATTFRATGLGPNNNLITKEVLFAPKEKPANPGINNTKSQSKVKRCFLFICW